MARRTKAGEVYADFSGDSKKFVAAATQSANSLKRIRTQAMATQKSLGGMTAIAKKVGPALVAAFSVKAIQSFVQAGRESAHQMADLGAKLSEMAASVGVSVEGLQGLRRAFEGQGVAAEKLDRGLGRINQRFADAFRLKTYRDAFEQLGIDIEALRDSGAQTEQILHALADGVAATGDRAAAASSLAQIFGRDWQQVYVVLKDGAQGLREAQREMEALGVVTARESQNLKAYAQTMTNIANVTETQLAKATADQVHELLILEEVLGKIERAWNTLKSSALGALAAIASWWDSESLSARILNANAQVKELTEAYKFAQESLAAFELDVDAGLLDPNQTDVAEAIKYRRAEVEFLASALGEAEKNARALRGQYDALGRAAGEGAGTAGDGDGAGTAVPGAGSTAVHPAVQRARLQAAELEDGLTAAYFDGVRKRGEALKKSIEEEKRAAKERIAAWYGFYAEQDRLARDAAEEMARIAEDAADRQAQAWDGAINRIKIDIDDLSATFKSAVAEMLRELLRFATTGESELLSGLGSVLAGLLGGGGAAAFGGGGASVFRGGMPSYGVVGGRALGGPVRAGSAYRINEQTPNSEIFVPGSDGYVFPSGALGSTFNLTTHIENATDPVATAMEVERANRDFERRVKAVVGRDARRYSTLQGNIAYGGRRG